MTNATDQRRCYWLLFAVLIVTTLAYWPGLHGPFLFDDIPNIVEPLRAWLSGQTGWRDVIFGNDPGLSARPLSMLTFLGNAAISGLAVWPFKVTNLAIHLGCGVTIYALLSRLLTRDPQLRERARLCALIITALWLLHPLQVSTVLYVVQRMAQLSALFMLLGLLAYVQGRLCLDTDRIRAARLYLFVAVPLATLAALLSKENGALVPLLCAVIELGYFRASAALPRPRVVKWFFGLFLLLPALAAFYHYGLHPQRLLASYSGRLFTLGGRLLSEPRALMDYIGTLLMPQGSMPGVYTDGFVVSRGLLDPVSTLLAITGLIGLVVAACWTRQRIPAFFTGIGLYLAGHSMESTVFPLQLYFEHRNYLPSVGFFLAVVGLAAWLLARMTPHLSEPLRARRWLAAGCGAILVVLGVATMVRASVWSSMTTIAVEGAHQFPQSMRAQLDYANVLQAHGRTQETQQVFDHMLTMNNPTARHAASIDSVALQCTHYGKTSAAAVGRIATIAGAKLQLAEMDSFEYLGEYLQKHDCTGLSKVQLATLILKIVNAAPQPATLTPLWRSRFAAAQLLVSAGDLGQAAVQAKMVWSTGAADPSVGVYLANIYYLSGDPASARLMLKSAEERIKPWDRRNLSLIAQLKRQFEPSAQTGTTTPGAPIH